MQPVDMFPVTDSVEVVCSWKTAEPVRGNETAGEPDKKYNIIEGKV